MAHQMLKPYSFLFYFLALVASFFVGLAYAGIVEAGKNHGLAGGAIVFGYGVLFGALGLTISLFVANMTSRKSIFRLNIILAFCIVGMFAYFYINHVTRQQKKAQEEQETQQPVPKTMSLSVHGDRFVDDEVQNSSYGIGMFSPNMDESKALYFYGMLNLEKTVMDHSPIDSVTFRRSEYNHIEIATAPPYLVPEHLKLDYGILLFKAVSVTSDFIEIEVNKQNNQTAFVPKSSGHLQYWPEFFLGINSVEFLDPEMQHVFVKPFDHAGKVNQSYSFMKPLRIKQEWMYVLLLSNDFETVGKGWIKWNEKGELLIRYSLLS